jgi:pilus assembly protein CpaB
MLRGLIFLVALSAGAVAVWMSVGAFGAIPVSTDRQEAGQKTSATEVLVAAIDLAPGSSVDPTAMSWQPWPQEALNPAFITREQRPDAIESFAGLVVRTGLITGEPIHDAKFAVRDAGALSVILSSGKRAVAVRISAENSAGGFVLPNDRVDVLLTTSVLLATGQNNASSRVIPTCTDQHSCAHLRIPMDLMRAGWAISLFQASQQ